ncbi:unnamed protein product, partial [Didymodactylos carnosus]
CTNILSRSIWNATTAKTRFILELPVLYITVQTLPSYNRSMTQQDCIRYINVFQTYNMNTNNYTNIKSSNAFKSLMDGRTKNSYVQQNYTFVEHYASPNIYQSELITCMVNCLQTAGSAGRLQFAGE